MSVPEICHALQTNIGVSIIWFKNTITIISLKLLLLLLHYYHYTITITI